MAPRNASERENRLAQGPPRYGCSYNKALVGGTEFRTEERDYFVTKEGEWPAKNSYVLIQVVGDADPKGKHLEAARVQFWEVIHQAHPLRQ